MVKKKHVVFAGVLLASVIIGAFFISKIKINNRGNFEGLFILKGENGPWLTITDDLYPFESPLLLWSLSASSFKEAESSGVCTPANSPCMEFEWNKKKGRGFIKNRYPDGKILNIAFGRFISTNGKAVSGLFLGGGLPATDPDFQKGNNNETGMSYFDGSRWFHIWCNVNEGMQDDEGKTYLPSTWTFLSSKILEKSAENLTLVSKHRVMVKNVPISVDRFLFYTTGDSFVSLKTVVKNTGKSPATVMYIYGDEPWIGNYDSFSKGNIGWYAGGLVTTEQMIDTNSYTYAGMFDYGNERAGESHSFTGKANFLEWSRAKRPDRAYFSNNFGEVAPSEQKVPLSSYKNRVFSLEWGPMVLNPGQSFSFPLKVGMAFNDPRTGYPVKPDTSQTN